MWHVLCCMLILVSRASPSTSINNHSYQDAKCLVTTGHGKYFSTGVDVSLFGSQSSRDSIVKVLSALQQLLCRLLTFPLLTVAAINGENSCMWWLVSHVPLSHNTLIIIPQSDIFMCVRNLCEFLKTSLLINLWFLFMCSSALCIVMYGTIKIYATCAWLA